MKEEIRSVAEKYGYSTYKINFSNHIDDIVEQILQSIIQGHQIIENDRLFMAEIFHIKRKEHVKALIEDQNFKRSLNEILSCGDYKQDGYRLTYNKPIYIDVASEAGCNNIHILNDSKIETLKQMGYGIQNFSIDIGKKIIQVECVGKHPNMNTQTCEFCLSKDLACLDLTLNNLRCIEETLSQINMDSTYLENEEIEKLRRLVNG
jgi:hypothetical protein